MSHFTVTVVGAGVIGTSIGLALKQSKDPFWVVGHDRELANAQAGVKMGAFDKAEWNLISACEKADLIILAIPINGIRATLEAIAADLKQGVVITDTARTKAPVLAWAGELLPEHAHFIGGDPIVHPTGSGHEHATATLFRDTLYCLTPGPAAEEQAVQLVVGVVNMLGAKAFFLDVVEHDGLVTAIEHLPTLLSAALMNVLSEQKSWREARKMAGGLFAGVSGGAIGEPEAISNDFLVNRDSLKHWLRVYIEQLNHIQLLLEEAGDGDERLVEWLDKAIVERHNWLVDYQKGDFSDPELVTAKIESPGLMKRLIGIGR